MASRMITRRKATFLVTQQTLTTAMKEAMQLAKSLPPNDPRAQELMQKYNEIANVLRSNPGNQDNYDDAKNPQVAQQLKAAVDRIAQLKNEGRQPMAQPAVASAKDAHQHLECLECEHSGFKNQQELDNHMADKHKSRLASKESQSRGEPMSSRLFARKKRVTSEDEMLDAAPEAVAGDAPAEPLPEPGMEPAPAAAPAPAPAPPTAGNGFANLPTEALSVIMEALTKIDQFETNPAIVGAIGAVADELKNRPVTPAQPEPAKAASKKVAVTPPGREEQVKALKKEPGIDNPWAVAWESYNKSHESGDEKEATAPLGWESAVQTMSSAGVQNAPVVAHWMKAEGYTPHKASFLVRRRGGAYWNAKFAAALPEIQKKAGLKTAENPGIPPVNEDTMEAVTGQPHEVKEIGEAHRDREGVAEVEKHEGYPGDAGVKITMPQDLEKQAAAETSEVSKALKTATTIEKKLGELYMDAKAICHVNGSAQVRDAIEGIFDVKNKFAEAMKVLNKHEMQAAAEEEAQKAALNKDKKASVPKHGLILAAAE